MGKGLSELQKTVLKMAFQNRSDVKSRGRWGGVDISNRDVLVGFYGFKPTRDSRCNVFETALIGPGRYKAASVAVAKTFNRLVWRGLCEREYGSGVRLTKQGVAVAMEIIRQ